jgi:hypothetical protein
MGLAIIAGGLSWVGTANAIDLILNGSFETVTGGTSAYNCHTDGTEAGWNGLISCIAYGYNYFSGPVIPAAENPGLVHSWNQDGDTNHTSGYTIPLTQIVDLTNGVPAATIDAGTGQFTFSAWMSSYTLQNDEPYLTVRFFDANTNQVGGTTVFDRVHSLFFTSFAVDFPSPSVWNDTTQLHDWAKYVRTAGIPPLARTATVGIQHSPNGTLTGRPDTYVDLVKLDVTTGSTRPSIESATPLDSGVPGVTSVNVTVRDGFYALNTGSVQFSFDGTAQTASVSKVGTLTTIQYTPGLLASGSSHSYQVVYNDNSPGGVPQTNSLSFKVLTYATLPPSYASPPGSGSHPGFTFRAVALNQDTTNTIDCSVARAEAQLAGTLIDVSTGQPFTNTATAGPNADGSYNITDVINFNDNGTTAGNFPDDVEFPGLTAPPYDFFSTEALLNLDLAAGYYRMGVTSDDGFKMAVPPPQGVAGSPALLGMFDGGRNIDDTLFDFFVSNAGVYPFRLVYFECTGNANCELYSVNLTNGTKVLVNDGSNANAMKSFLVVPPRITSIVQSGSNVNIQWAYGNPPFQVQFKNNLYDLLWSNSGGTTSSRSASIPISSGAAFFRIVGSP